jgi:CheY-like chemotaxis protein
VNDSQLKFRKFHDLMPHRVREVLLVSSPYEAFILEQDGQLTERIFTEYSELNLTSAPRVTHVSSAEDAVQALQQRRFDLVIAMLRISDMDVFAFGRRIKELRPGKPVVLLALDEFELRQLPARIDPAAIDKVFLWNGDAKILLAIIKYIEDRENAEHDIRTADIRVIIVVEDSVRYYSAYFAMLYTELMSQSQSLIAEGVNDLHKVMRLRARPKILLASSYEEAVALYERYQHNVLAVISDVRYPRGGRVDREAGFHLLGRIRNTDPSLPVLLQSADEAVAERAREMGAHFLNKRSPGLLMEIREFLQTNLGFGDFVFRRSDGTEVARARDLLELERLLGTVPVESLEFHARQNHISIWLMARCEFELARQLRPQKVSDFQSIDELRHYLIEVLAAARREAQEGMIADFSRRQFDPSSRFVRLGKGSLGGKARGVAFASSMLALPSVRRRFGGMAVRIPKSLVIGTQVFDRFLEAGDLNDFAYTCEDDAAIKERFLASPLPEDAVADLRFFFRHVDGPLAVRSSSLLEDSHFQTFAGIYSTYMLPNNDLDADARLESLCQAVKLVFASTFSRNAKAYIAATPYRIEEEKMAVLVQELVGRRFGDHFYPHFAGVAESYNFYPIGPQRPEDGVAQVALGLGRMVVEGGEALRFSPRHPQVLPQFSTPQAVLKTSQRSFYALDLSKTRPDLRLGPESTVKRYDLAAAESDGTLGLVGSVYSAADNIIRDSLDQPGPRVVTFNNVLKWGTVPLAETLATLLEVSHAGMGSPVELEFAVDLGDETPTLYFLQLRPFAGWAQAMGAEVELPPRDQALCLSHNAMGFGRIGDLYDIVHVRREKFDPARSREIAREVGELNERLVAERRPYVLVGPGRWGTAEHWLGIPVQWLQIAGAKVIVESFRPGFYVDPSQGTHFFQNITSLRIGYLTVREDGEEMVDWEWLAAQPALRETEHLRHVRLEAPVVAHLDGRRRRGAIVKP